MRSKITLLVAGIYFFGFFALPFNRLLADGASISCLQYVQLSLSGSGETVIPPEVLLANSYSDYSIFVVEITDPPTGNDVADCSMVGEVIMVMVTNSLTNNSCWSNVLIEDKTSPVVNCSDVVLPCYESVDFDDIDFLLDTIYDNCTSTEDLDVWYSQTIHALNCDPLFSIYLNRTWTVTDESGNSSTCQHNIYFERGNVADVEMPSDTTLECPQVDTDPDFLGFPTLDGMPINGFCELAVTFSDEVVPLCGNSFKIKRTWQIFDWCTGEMATHIQHIEILDTTPPVIDCPGDVTVFTGTQVCEGTHIFPFLNFDDACADNADVNIRFRVEGILILDPLVVLPVGEHVVEIEATDPCFNTSFCEYTVTVEDNVPPVLVCHNLVVTLNNNGDKIPLNVSNITDFVYIDNCGIAEVEIRRMEDGCDEPEDTVFGEVIHLCCEDVANGVVTEIRAIDIYGNENSCMFNITVQDKLPPTITFCPPDTTINCNDEMTDLSVYGQALAEDNCEVIFSEFSVSEIDECGEGFIFRTLIASDASGNADSCVQVITVVNPFGITPNDIQWPDNIFITECNANTDPESLGSFPQVMVDHCPISVGINFSDVVTGIDEPCLLISRTWEVFDSCNQVVVGTHVQTIEVRNNAGPNLTGPDDVTVYVDEVSCFVQLNLDAVEADDCSFGVVIENNYNNQGGVISDEFEVGVTTVVFIAEDECGNTSSFSVVITVLDTIPPSILCPEDLVVDNDAGECGAVVEWDEPQPEDNCPGVTAVPTQLPGEFFQVGSEMVTYVATDASGNTAECSFNITVEDTEPPSIIDCPEDIMVGNDFGECGAIVEWQAPDAEDNCPGVVLESNFESGDFFGVGSHMVTYIVTDGAGNTADCSFEITVEDDENPEIVNCPEDISVENDFEECGAVVQWQIPFVEDNCPGVELTSSHESGDFFPVGTTVVTYVAVDATGNSAECNFEVTVEDTELPIIINCPEDIEIENEPGECFALAEWELPIAEDNCPDVELVGSHQLGDTFPVGTTVITYVATDASGNSASCIFEITVVDVEPPIIICPEDIEVNAQSGECEIFVEIELPEITDNCGVDTFFNSYNLLEDASDIYEVGTTIVTYTVIDIFGNLDSCSFEVTVIRDFELIIECPEDIIQANDPGVCEAFVEIELPVVTGFCQLDSVFNSYNQSPNASDVYIVGETVVEFTAIDADGSTATCEFTVIVEDTESPEITCPDDVNTVNDPDSCSAFVQIDLPLVDDNCEVDSVVNSITLTEDASSVYEVGTTTVVFTAFDEAGNSASCIFTVTVDDVEPPTIVCPDNITQENDPGECSASVDIPLPEAEDNCVVVSIENNYNGLPDASDTYPVGITLVQFTAEDAAGNTGICSFTVTVEDVEPPVIDGLEDITAEVNPGECDLFISIPIPDVTDNCELDTFFNDYNGTIDASDVYPVGVTVVTYTAIDIFGNISMDSFTVTVTGDEPLALECPLTFSAPNDPFLCSAELVLPLPDVIGGCEIDSIFNNISGEGAAIGVFEVGLTIVIYTVVDIEGNSATCSFEVIVEDTESPEITCPDNVNTVNDPDSCSAFVQIDLPLVEDNCEVDSVVNSITLTEDASSVYEVGTTVVVFTAFDESGNSATCSFTVTVDDIESPMIECPDSIIQENDPGECSASVDIPLPEAEDNCGVVSIENNYNGLPDASDTYPVGSTLVQFTAEDAAGNTGICSFTVTVQDLEPPVIDGLQDITAEVDPGECEILVNIPVPDVTDNCALDTFFNSFNGTENASGVYPLGETVVIYTAIDVAGNISLDSFTVTVTGGVELTIICPSDTIVENDPGLCEAFVEIALADAFGGCGVDSVFNDYNFTEDASDVYPVGVTTVVFTAIDVEGTIDTCHFSVTVVDFESPEIECPDDIVVGNDSLECSAFVNIAIPIVSDNCEVDSIVNDYNFTEDASDIYPVGQTIVTYTSTDVNGNTATCSFIVEVLDVEAPFFISCPQDTIIACDELPADLLDLGEAIADDNCGVEVLEEIVISEVDTCSNTGDLFRLFIATDSSGNADTCQQVITLEGQSQLDSIDFIWPDPVVVFQECGDFDPDSLPFTPPFLNPDILSCNVIGISNVDEVLEIEGECDQILRTWTVIDSCNYNPDLGLGIWTFEQFFSTEDTTAPVFVNTIDTFIFFLHPDSCSMFLNITAEAIDDCTEDVEITNDSPISNGNGNDASGMYPAGITEFSFIAVDNCGNVSEIEIFINLIDTIGPIIICDKVPVVMTDDLEVVVFGEEVITSLSDNCADSADIIITFDLNDLGLDSLLLTCDDIDPDLVVTVIEGWLYVLDGLGGVDSCKFAYEFGDPFGFCKDDLEGGIVNGLIFDHGSETGLPGVEMFLTSSGENYWDFTDQTGYYQFDNIPWREKNFHLSPYDNRDPLNGVTTYDIFLMQRHILGLGVIEDPYYLIAADANNDGRIDVRDVVELRGLILGRWDNFRNNTSWRFFDADYIMPHGIVPTEFELPEIIWIDREEGGRVFEQNFIGVKIGDLNGNVSIENSNATGALQRSVEGILKVWDKDFHESESIEVPIYLKDNDDKVSAFQFALKWPKSRLTLKELDWNGALNVTVENYNHMSDGEFEYLLVSYSRAEGVKLSDESPFFNLVFKTIEAGSISNTINLTTDILKPELVVDENQAGILRLDYSRFETALTGKSFELFQNVPNPFNGNTMIRFNMPEEESVDFKVIDAQGRLLVSTEINAVSGINEIEINTESLRLDAGVYYYQIKTSSHHAVKKMVIH